LYDKIAQYIGGDTKYKAGNYVIQTRQTWTEKEREEIRAQNKLHPEYS